MEIGKIKLIDIEPADYNPRTITEEIADFLEKELNPKGVIVTIKDSEHLCMLMRGVETKSANITTSAVRGVFYQKDIKDEFLQLIN